MRKCVFLFAVTLAVMLNTTNGWGQEVVFSEGFDDSANLPAGWTQSGDPGCYWYVSNRNVEGYPNNPYSGNYSAFSYLNGRNDTIKLITPAIDMSSYETVKLTFAYINMEKESKWSNSIDRITIYYRTSSSDSWQQIANILNKHEVWTLSDEYEIETSSSPTFQIAFMGYSMSGYGVGIDNVKIVDATQCHPIASDIMAVVDNRHVTLTWEAPTGATRYKYILSESELEEPDFTSATTITTASMTFDVGGQGNLTGETDYWFYVKTGCNAGAHDNDYKSVQFTTLETCPSPKNVTVTDVQKHQFTIAWENSQYATDDQGYELLVNTTGEQPDIADGAQVDGITGTYYTIENLARNTHYYVYMRGTCDDAPEWKRVAETTTLGLGMDCDYEIVANGNDQNLFAPVYGGYEQYAQRIQMLYPSSMLTNLVGSNISEMKFFVNYGTNNNWKDCIYTISMATTDATSLSSDFITESMTEVYSGKLTINGTMPITFDNDFEYTGNNLLIEINFSNPGYYAYDVAFYSVATNETCTRTVLNDYPTFIKTSQNLPKVEFKVCKEVKACPEVTNLKANYIS